MFPAVLPVTDVIYRSFYDEQEYRLKMQQLAGFGPDFERGGNEVAPAAGRISALRGRLRDAASAVAAAVLRLQPS